MRITRIVIPFICLALLQCTNDNKGEKVPSQEEETVIKQKKVFTLEEKKRLWLGFLETYFNSTNQNTDYIELEGNRLSNDSYFPENMRILGKEAVNEIKAELLTYELNESYQKDKNKTHTLLIDFKEDNGILTYIQPAKNKQFELFEYFITFVDGTYKLTKIKTEDFKEDEHD